MTINLAKDGTLIVWILTALAASLATGCLVGILVSTAMRTYQLVVWIFLGAAITWLMAAFVSGAVNSFLLDALLGSNYLLFGIIAGLITLCTSFCLVRLGQNYRALRWSVTGALAAWLTGAIGASLAYDNLNRALLTLPDAFWGSLMLSMAISTILGAAIGGMVFRHRQLWRQFQ
jgi:hypothetical protein